MALSNKEKFEVPSVKEVFSIPAIEVGSMAHSKPFVAKPEHQEPLGFPGELVDGWQDAAITKMGELLGKYRSVQVFLDSCVKCGACTDKCHYYLGTADPKNMPVARQDLLRNVYRRYFTVAGKYFPKLVGAVDLTEEVIEDWYRYYHQCSECRRCSVYCPYGIDTAEITMAGREILASIGIGQKYANEIITKVHKIGNNLGLPEPALLDTLEGLEEEVEEDTGVAVKYPLDQQGAEVLLVTPSADFFAEPHVDGLIGYGKVFHQAGVSWTLSSHASEAANFGIFIGNYENMKKVAWRVREAALELGVKRIVLGECGHAWRVAYSFWNTLIGPFDFLDPDYPVPQHICEFTYDLLKRGALRINPEENDDKVVTFHDSCNVSRGSRMGDIPGGQFIIPREVIKAACNHFVDMAPETTHENTYCCGGGGGIVSIDEIRPFRTTVGGKLKADQIRAVGCKYLVAPCANCKKQIEEIISYYKLPMKRIGLHDLILKAIVME